MVHLVPINTMTKSSELVLLYVKEVVHLHRLPDSIISDRDSKFTLMFWRETHWVDKLPLMEFAINSNISSLMGFNPFELNYGYMPSLCNWRDHALCKCQTWH